MIRTLNSWRARGWIHLALFGCLALTFLAYRPGLNGPFVFDDYSNIVDNASVRIERLSLAALYEGLMSGTAGPLKRPLTMLSFAVNHALTGITPYWFKLTNVGIHLLNGLLVYLLCTRLLALALGRSDSRERPRHAAVALVATALWLAHPVQLTSVLYVVQRMTSLSATFVFLGLIVYLDARRAMIEGRLARARLWLGVPACTAAAVLAKENGALLPLFAFVIECTLLRFRGRDAARWGTLSQFFFLCVGLPLAAAAVLVAVNPAFIDPPGVARPFTMGERLLTESRVLWFYLEILVAPAPRDLALYYDDFVVSRGLLSPPTTLLAIGGILAAVVAAVLLRRRMPWLAFGVGWFLAGHAMESSFIMLELVHTHRNYVAYLGPMLGACVGVSRAVTDSRRWLPALAAVLVVGLALLVTAQRASQWGDPIRQVAWEVHHQPDSARSNYELARIYYLTGIVENTDRYKPLAQQHFWQAAELEPKGISALVGLLILTGEGDDAAAGAALEELKRRAGRYPLASRDIVYLKSLVGCLAKGNCTLPPAEALAIFGRMLSHPGLGDAVKANVLAVFGMYYANVLGDMPACVRVMREATILQPHDANHRLNLVQALMMSGDYEEAARELARVEASDPLGVHRQRMLGYRTDLLELAAGAGREAK